MLSQKSPSVDSHSAYKYVLWAPVSSSDRYHFCFGENKGMPFTFHREM